MKNYHDMSAVITGGASGLGLATAKRLRKAGVKVAIFDMNAELGEKVAKEIGAVFCMSILHLMSRLMQGLKKLVPPMAKNAFS